VATGITEKLNQKRINAAMSEPEEEQLGALQLVAQIGEGGFAKVFRGLYRCVTAAHARCIPYSMSPQHIPCTPYSMSKQHAGRHETAAAAAAGRR